MNNKLTVLNKQFYTPIHKDFTKQLDTETFQKEVNFAIQIFKKNSYLQNCDQKSVLDSVLNISMTGLTLNPVLNYAYLVPHKGKCVLYPSYQGLCKLATDTGSIKSIECHLIYQGDTIDIDLASDKKISSHKPYFLNGNEKGNILGGYSIAILQNGLKHIELMSIKDIYDIRNYSESYKAYKAGKIKSCIWIENEGEMCRKTIVKRHFKYLPKSHVPDSMQKAIELDNLDYDFPATYEQGNYIESLLITSTIDEKTQNNIYQTLANNGFTQKRAAECIEYLKQNQQDQILSGNGNYTQQDIQKKLSEINNDPKK